MNKTFLRALPVFAIFSLIVIGVFIVSHTNENKSYPMVEDTETVIYSTKDGDVEVTKGEIYNFLRYNNSINDEIDQLIVTEVLKGSTDGENYFETIRNDDELNEEVEFAIVSNIFGIDLSSDNPYESVKTYSLQLNAQKYIDNHFLETGEEIDFDINSITASKPGDFVSELSEKVFKIDSVYEQAALAKAQELFAEDILDEEVEDDGFDREDSPVYIESDELDNLVEDLYENQKNATSYAYGVTISFDSIGELKTASDAVVDELSLEIGFNENTTSYIFVNPTTPRDDEDDHELTDEELLNDENQVHIFELYVGLYDYLYSETRHALDGFSLHDLFFSGTRPTSLDSIDFEDAIAAEEDLWYKEVTYISALSGKFPTNAPDSIKQVFEDDLEDDESIFNYLISSNSTESLSNYIFSETSSLGVVGSTDRDELPFTEVPKTYSGQKHIVTLFDVTEAGEFEDLSEDELKVYEDLAKENYIDDALSSSYIQEKFNDAIADLNITIYDELIGKTFTGSNPSYDVNVDAGTKYVATIGDTNYTAEDFYEMLFTTSDFTDSITSLSKDQFVLNYADGVLYDSYFGESTDILIDEAKNIKLSFGLGQASCPEFAEGYSWTEYLNLCYFVENEVELLDKIAVEYLSHDFNMINFAPNNFNSDESDLEDYEGFYDETNNKIEVNDDLITSMEDSVADYTLFYESYNSVTANHLLVSLSKNDGSGFANPTYDGVITDADGNIIDPEWSDNQKDAAKAILEQIVAFEQDDEATYLEALELVVEQYEDASYGSDYITNNSQLVNIDKDDYEANSAEYFGYFKRLGLELKVEELGAFGTDQMVTPFEDRIKSLFTIDEFIDKVLNDDADEAGYLDETAVATEFGYHLINITEVGTAPSSTLTQEDLDEFNEELGFLPEYQLKDDLLQAENADESPQVPSKAQLEHYLRLVQSDDLTLRLPDNLVESISYYYTPIESERLSASMLNVYYIETFMSAESDTFDTDVKKLLERKNAITEAQNSGYRELTNSLR